MESIRKLWALSIRPKIPEISEQGRNGTEICSESFQKIRKVLTFRNANHSTENPGNYRRKIKWN